MSKVKLAVIFPSRGLAFSQTCEELLDNLEGYDNEIYFAHGLSIPNCFNKPLERALESQATHFWIVEDDMVLPKHTLKRLLAAKVPAIVCDYPMDAEGKPAVFSDPDDNIIFGGTGCLLVTRQFLEAYPKPIFRTGIAWDMKVGETVEFTPRQVLDTMYGLHDVSFSLEAYRRGTPIKLSKIRCGHRKLKQLGVAGSNIGFHDIEVWTKLVPNKLAKVKNPPFVEVELPDGTIANVKADSPLARNRRPKYVEFVE